MGKSLQESNYYLMMVGLVLIVLAVVAFVAFLLHGSSITVNGGGNVTTTHSVSCEGNDATYPFGNSGEADKKSLSVKMVLNGDKMSTISLVYKLYYSDVSKIEKARMNFNSAINESFGESGIEADSFGATYSILSDAMQMTLYAEAKDINETAAKYFLLEDTNGNYEKNQILKAYSEKGLSCIVNE